MFSYRFFFLFLTLFIFSAHPAAAAPPSVAGIYGPYGALLEKYLIEKQPEGGGLVSAFQYGEALRDPGVPGIIAEQEQRLKAFDPGQLTEKDQATAFWINAYNFFMLSHILQNPKNGKDPVDGVKDYGTRLNPYRVFQREIFTVGGRKYSLDRIEKKILLGEAFKRKGWKDARIHFAVNCASVGCPSLRKEIYTPQTLDALLTENTRRALRTLRHMRFDGDILYLSQLFEWYEPDFEQQEGGVRSFLKRYTDPALHRRIDQAQRIRYIDYDWSLNAPRNFVEFSGPRQIGAQANHDRESRSN